MTSELICVTGCVEWSWYKRRDRRKRYPYLDTHRSLILKLPSKN